MKHFLLSSLLSLLSLCHIASAQTEPSIWKLSVNGDMGITLDPDKRYLLPPILGNVVSLNHSGEYVSALPKTADSINTLSIFDSAKGELLFSKELNVRNIVRLTDNNLIIADKDSLSKYDIRSGALLCSWPANNDILFGRCFHNCLICKAKDSEKRFGYSTETGELLWEIEPEKYEDFTEYKTEDAFFIYGKNLYKIDKKDNSLKTLKLNNQQKRDYRLTLLGTMEQRYYVADNKNLYCLDNDLNIVWSVPNPQRGRYDYQSSHMKGDTIFLLRNNDNPYQSTVYVSAYKATTGQVIFSTTKIDGYKLEDTDNDTLYFRVSNKLKLLSLNDMNIREIPWEEKYYPEISFYLGKYYYLNQSSQKFERFNAWNIYEQCVKTKSTSPCSNIPDKLFLIFKQLANGNQILAEIKKSDLCSSCPPSPREYWITTPDFVPVYHFSDPIFILSIEGNTISYMNAKDEFFIAKF